MKTFIDKHRSIMELIGLGAGIVAWIYSNFATADYVDKTVAAGISPVMSELKYLKEQNEMIKQSVLKTEERVYDLSKHK